ncbi:MAG: antibiotic biosynthesis monooxygenase [Chloroflexi bacterium]|nr:antibiotic biosynthesis monooxygenase [Chloroflexota bacterium]
MTVKVLIERKVREGYEPYVWNMLRTIRSEALRQRGYLYGETWRSLEDPGVLVVISTWGTREHYEFWSMSPFRQKMEERLLPMLAQPPIVHIFEEFSGP